LFFDFILAESDQWQSVKLTIMAKGTENVLIICQYDGVDSCYLPKQSLKSDTALFIAIQCQDDCKYNFNAHWSDL